MGRSGSDGTHKPNEAPIGTDARSTALELRMCVERKKQALVSSDYKMRLKIHEATRFLIYCFFFKHPPGVAPQGATGRSLLAIPSPLGAVEAA